MRYDFIIEQASMRLGKRAIENGSVNLVRALRRCLRDIAEFKIVSTSTSMDENGEPSLGTATLQNTSASIAQN